MKEAAELRDPTEHYHAQPLDVSSCVFLAFLTSLVFFFFSSLFSGGFILQATATIFFSVPSIHQAAERAMKRLC